MHNLFTPVEVIRSQPTIYMPQALLQFKQEELYTITQPKVLSLADERKHLLTWFRGLPLLERRQVATFHSPQFACLLGRLFQEWQSNSQSFKYRFTIKNGKYCGAAERSYFDYRQNQRQLLSQVILISKSQLYEAITLSDQLLKEPQFLFQLLDQLHGGVVEYMTEFQQEQIETFRVSFGVEAEGEPKLLGVWVGTFIMKQLSLFFTRGTASLAKVCEHHRSQQRDYSRLWTDISNQQKGKLLKSAFFKSTQLIMANYAQNLEIDYQWLPRVYIEETQVQRMQKWELCNPKELISQLTYTPLQSSFELGNLYRMELILQIEGLLSEKARPGKHKKKKNKKKASKDQVVKDFQTSVENTTVPENKAQINGPPQVHEDCREEIQGREMKTQTLSETKTTQQNQPDSPIQKVQVPESKEDDFKLIPNKKAQSLKIKSQLQKMSLNPMLETLFKKIKEDSRDRYRKIILHRLIHILSQVGIVCKPYGSYASQLSLPDSDLDVSVDSSVLSFFSFESLSHRNQIIIALQYIANILKRYPWIQDFQLLDKARVPLLTFNANASHYFEFKSEDNIKLKLNGKKLDPQKSMVQVDLTIQPFANTPQLPHCGLQSTESLRSWMLVFPLLEKTIIIIKLLLRKAKLHKTFQGGIGSYAVSLFVIAYFRQEGSQAINIQKVLQGFSIFIQEFYTNKWLIDSEGDTPLVKEQQLNGPVLRHPFEGHNILEKSLKFPIIVDTIKDWPSLFVQTP